VRERTHLHREEVTDNEKENLDPRDGAGNDTGAGTRHGVRGRNRENRKHILRRNTYISRAEN